MKEQIDQSPTDMAEKDGPNLKQNDSTSRTVPFYSKPAKYTMLSFLLARWYSSLSCMCKSHDLSDLSYVPEITAQKLTFCVTVSL